MPCRRLLVRAAVRLRAVYSVRAAHALVRAIADAQSRCQAALGRVRSALADRGPVDAPELRRHLQALVAAARDAAREACAGWGPSSPAVPHLRCLLAELGQLEDEFGGLQIDLRKKVLSVTTEPVELEGVYLGPFALHLVWDRLAGAAGADCFRVEALDPHPAADNGAVTHPHVRDGELCPGEAADPLRRALEQGRLADAFCLVRGVLGTYNGRSAHVPLDSWSGSDCSGCDAGADPDELRSCEGCGSDYCADCLGRCAACGERHCHECLERCHFCKEAYCPGCLLRQAAPGKACCRRCLRTCAGCQALVPPDRLAPDSLLCPGCAAEGAAAGSAACEDVPPIPQSVTPEDHHAPPPPTAAAP